MLGKVSNSFLWYFITSGSSNILKNKGHMTEGHRPHITILLIAWETAPVFPCPVLPCPALPYPALPCPVLPCSDLPCSALHCSALPCHFVLTFFLQITTMVHGQHKFQHLLFRFTPCYMESPHFYISTSDFGHDTGTAYFQHLLCRFLPCYMDSLHLNI